MEPIDETLTDSEQPNFNPPEPEPVPVPGNEPPRRSIWQRLRAYFANRQINILPAEDRLRNDGNPINLIIDRYFRHRHCPYCFGFVSSRVYRERSRPGGTLEISGIPMSLPKIKIYECPSCGKALPSDFFANRSSSIALVGGIESGKSTFITIFCELLLYQRSTLSELGIFGSIINPEGQQQFDDNRMMLIRQERTLDATSHIQEPIVVRLHSKHHQRVTYITLLDSPGEQFSNVHELTVLHPNLQYANGIVFLMNPLDIAELLRLISKGKPGTIPSNREVNVRNFEIIENLYQLYLQSGRIKPNLQITTPTAFCLSRADLLEDVTNLYLPPDFDPDLSETEDILEEMNLVTEDLRELLEETDLNLLNIMDKRFRNYGLFPVSPLGKTPSIDAMGQLVDGGVNPKGVLQPIIWILRATKFIPYS